MPAPQSLLIKPAGPDCNLRCGHCFYLGKAALFPAAPKPRMTEEVLEALMRNYLRLRQQSYAFCWQGGEPTLMGAAFFRRVTDLQQSLAAPGSIILNSVQTNGTLMTDELAAHLADYRFLAGVSLDGPPRLHDAHRRTRKGGGTHQRVMAGLEVLRRHGVPVNILTLVSCLNAAHPGELYRYLVDLGFTDLQFIPLVSDPSRRKDRGRAITGRGWGEFLCGLFDAWWPHGPGRIAVRHFDAVAARLAPGRGRDSDLCTLGEDCRRYLVVEHDGSVYPCDFFVEPRRRLGNVMTDSIEDMRESEAYAAFGSVKRAVPPTCRQCRWLRLCQGDCPANRPPASASLLCEGWLAFFDHAMPRLERLARLAARMTDPGSISDGRAPLS